MKRKSVKCYIISADRRIELYWAIPKNKIVSIKGIDKAFVINDKDFFISNKIPAYIYDVNNINPKNPYNPDSMGEVSTPEDLDVAISAHVAREILLANSNNMDKATIAIIVSVLGIGAIAVVWYMINGRLDEIMELLKLIGGM
jgi:hypothetical protein